MNIAGQAYQDGQEDRKANGMQRTAILLLSFSPVSTYSATNSRIKAM